MRRIVPLAIVLSSGLALPAATPPDRVNYQGVLRDAAGAPRNGLFDMIFRLFDQEIGGSEILQDSHAGGGSPPVVVTDGLFSVEIGSGQVLDGWGPGFYPTLGEAFQDYGELWLEIEIGGETLSPRLRFASAGYALNAGALAGRTADEFLDTGPDPQVKSGALTLSGASVPGGASLTAIGTIGARVESTSGALAELARYGDGLWAWSGPGSGSAGVFYAYGGTAVNALGAYTGGYFQDLDNSSWAYVANGDFGARIQGQTTGAYIQTPGAATSVWLADSGYGIRAFGPNGGYFANSSGDGTVSLAIPSVGVDATGGGWGVIGRGGYVGVYGSSETGDGGEFYAGPFGDYNGLVAVAGYGTDLGAAGYFDYFSLGGPTYVATETYKIQGPGSVAFVQNHPTEKDRVIVYNSLEGDEVATYTRGSARLAGGKARIALGETFAWVTNPDLGLTAHLTPHGEPVPLAVETLTTKELVVRAPTDAPPDLEFDYIVYGLRIGFEETSIVQEKRQEAYLPSFARHRRRYAEHPELQRFNALERVKGMRIARGLEAPPDLTASIALRQAIHEFDPAVDRPEAEPGGDGLGRWPRVATGGPAAPGPEAAQVVGPARVPPIPAAAARPPSSAGSASVPAAYRSAGAGAPALAAPAPNGDVARSDVVTDPAPRAPLVTPGSSLGERFAVSEPVRAGELLAIDPLDPERVHRAEGIADPRFIGIAAADSSDDGVALASSRVVTVWADAASGAIVPGDLLTTSPAPGLAMRAVNPAAGAVFGKALDPLESGTGEIRVLWMPH